MSGAIDTIRRDIAAIKPKFQAVAVAPDSILFEREAGFAIQALTGNEYAMGIALKNKDSVLAAVTNISAIGISLNPAKRQAYLVPRDGRICLDISYMGLLDLAIQSGSIRWGQAEIVYEKDEFALNDADKLPTHKRNPFGKDRGQIIGAYVVVKTADGDYLTTAMSIDEVWAIRDRSSAWKAFLEKKRKCPWVTDEGEMIKKTVIKRAYKMWPKTDRLDTAVHYLNNEGGEGIELSGGAGNSEGGQPMSGALDNIDADQMERVRSVAARVVKGFHSLGAEAAADYIAQQNFDAEETIALWKLLGNEPTMRAAIKKAQKAEPELDPAAAEHLKSIAQEA